MVTASPPRQPLPVRAVLFVVNRSLKSVRHAAQRAKVGWRHLRYRMRESPAGRAAWRASTFVQAPRETGLRRRVAAEYAARVRAEPMTPEQGYRLFGPAELAGIGEVLDICRAHYDRKVVAAEAAVEAAGPEGDAGLKARPQKREYLRNLLGNDDLRASPALVDFALSDGLLGLAAGYLGTVPHLNRVDLLYSVPRPDGEKVSSQLFHVDPEGLTQVKFFINVFDVGDAEGPFTFIPAAETARVIRDVGQWRRRQGKAHTGRYLDDEIAAVGAAGAVIRVEGPPGSAVAVDTSRCMHMGSRVRAGAFRLCLYLQYCTTRERGNVFDIGRYRDDPVRYLAVQHSVESSGGDLAAPHQMGGEA